MYVPDIELHEAATLEQASEALRRYAPSARLLAGGTDVLVDLKTGRIDCDHLVSINRIAALHNISEVQGQLRIGALATISELLCAPAVRSRFAPLLDAADKMAAAQIRNAATAGGNIAAAVPCADLPPILIAMNASVVLWRPDGERETPLDAFYTGPRQTVLREDEVLTEIIVPEPPAGFGAAYARFQLRDGNAIAVASVGASLLLDADGRVRDARIVLGAVAPVPKLVEAAGAVLTGKPPEVEGFEQAARIARENAEPISDVRASAEHRRDLVQVLTRRALATAYRRAGEVRP